MQNPAHCHAPPFGVRFRCSTRRLTPRATHVKEFVMRPSRFLVVMFFSLGSLLFLDSSSHGQTVTSLYSFPGHASAEPGSVVPSQGRDGRLYGTTVGVGTSGTIFAITTTGVA